MEGNGPKTAKKFDLAGMLYDWCDAFVYALVVIIAVFTIFFKVTNVVGTSMLQTLYENDTLVITKLGYEPRRGDVVVLSIENDFFHEPIVKRVIATGGETVYIDFDREEVRVTDREGVTHVLDEPYVYLDGLNRHMSAGDMEYPLYVEEGMLFVMGDHRNGSTDSRYSMIGLVDERRLVGRVLFRVLPLSRIGTVQ